MQLRPEDLRRALAAPPRQVQRDTARKAAVAAVFTPDLELLLMKRAEIPGDPWSGHLSFPGGRMHPEDPDLFHVAVRETREELGLDLFAAEPLGALDDFETPAALPQLLVRPFVFLTDRLDLAGLVPDPREVAGVTTLPLSTLLAGEGREEFVLDYRGQAMKMPRVVLPGLFDTPLWGLTLRVIDGLLTRLDGRERVPWTEVR